MATEAHYEFMNAVYKDLKDKKHTHGPNHTWIKPPNKMKALTQVKTRLFAIQLDLRPELPLPQHLVDKIYHEALMSEFMEKLPKFKNTYRFRHDTHLAVALGCKEFYRPPRVFSFWIDLCYQLKTHSNSRTIRGADRRDGEGGWVNKKEYLIGILSNNGVKCDKKWTVKRLAKAL